MLTSTIQPDYASESLTSELGFGAGIATLDYVPEIEPLAEEQIWEEETSAPCADDVFQRMDEILDLIVEAQQVNSGKHPD